MPVKESIPFSLDIPLSCKKEQATDRVDIEYLEARKYIPSKTAALTWRKEAVKVQKN